MITPNNRQAAEPAQLPAPISSNSGRIWAFIYNPARPRMPLEKVVALRSESGNIYELNTNRRIFQTIYGGVYEGFRLNLYNNTDPNRIVYVRSNMHLAIKVYSIANIETLGQIHEDPTQEFAALQFLGDYDGMGTGNINILGQIELMITPEEMYSVMRRFNGSDLWAYVRELELEEDILGEEKAKHIFKQLLHAVEYLHSFGMAHRDISLENILYDPEDHRAVLIDFGMCIVCTENPNTDPAWNMVELTRTLFMAGKPRYLAPEMNDLALLHQGFDPMLADIWMMGVVLQAMVTGQLPIRQAVDTDNDFQRITSDYMDYIATVGYDQVMSPDLQNFIQGILRRDPAERLTLTQMRDHEWLQH